MTLQRLPGMDHNHYQYETILQRSPVTWPRNANVAAFVLLHIESFELQSPAGSYRDPRFRGEFGSYDPDFRSWSAREYGNRVGFWRILELLDELKIPASIAIDAQSCGRYPAIVKAISDRGWEAIAHGISITQMVTNGMTEEQERKVIAISHQTIADTFGRQPSGWLAPDFGESERSPSLIAESRFSYLLDWANDNAPYWMSTTPPIVSIPNQFEWEDTATFGLRRVPIQRYPQLVRAALDTLREEGRNGPRIFGLSLHPWFIGAPHRFNYLAVALRDLASRPGLWWASTGEIADVYRESVDPLIPVTSST